jgi:hypothetical protein
MVSALQTIKMYELLNKHFNDREDAQVLVEGIEGVIAAKFDTELDRLATKEDILRLEKTSKEELITTKGDLTIRINGLETRIEQGLKDQLKWIIILMVSFAGLIIAMIKLD